MKTVRKIIEINEALCDGCGQCVPACKEAAIQIMNGKAKLVSDVYCDGLGACLGRCPRGAIRIVEREADAFDGKAVQAHLRARTAVTPPVVAACPSAQLRRFARPAPSTGPENTPRTASALAHWPVQIRLVPPAAPFLHQADLLIAADCVPVAYPNFHQDFLAGRVVLVGCPKLDDLPAYVEKFKALFLTATIRSVLVVVMQVPCCQSLPGAVRQGMELAGKAAPLETVVIGLQGDILARKLFEPPSEKSTQAPV